MKVSHKVDHRQVEEVLTQFEATTSAIRGIDEKVARVDGYVAKMKTQRENITRQAETVTGLVDRMSDTLNSRSDDILMFFTDTLDNFAGLVEKLEQRLLELRLQDAPRQIQREFGPLLMPAVVLVIIITVSNCIFGFLLAGDSNLSDSFSILQDEAIKDEQPLNILKVFAVMHVALIGAAVLFVMVEACRKKLIPIRSSEGRQARRGYDTGPYVEPADSSIQSEDSRSSPGRLSRGRRPSLEPDQPFARSQSQASFGQAPPYGRTSSSDVVADVRQRVAELRLRRRNSDPYIHEEANVLAFARCRSEGVYPGEADGAGLGFAGMRPSTASSSARPRGPPASSRGAGLDEALSTWERRFTPNADQAPQTPERHLSPGGDQASEPPQGGQADAPGRLRRLELPQPSEARSPTSDERQAGSAAAKAARSPGPDTPASASPAVHRKGGSGSREAAARGRGAAKQGLGSLWNFWAPAETDNAGGSSASGGGTKRTPVASALRRLQKASAPITERLKGAEPSDGTPRRKPSEGGEDAEASSRQARSPGAESTSSTPSRRQQPSEGATAAEPSPGGGQARSPGAESVNAAPSPGSSPRQAEEDGRQPGEERSPARRKLKM